MFEYISLYVRVCKAQDRQRTERPCVFLWYLITGRVHRVGAKVWCSLTARIWDATGPSAPSKLSTCRAPGSTAGTTRYSIIRSACGTFFSCHPSGQELDGKSWLNSSRCLQPRTLAIHILLHLD